MNWRYIMIHHSATRDGRTFSWEAIRRYHTRTLGWSDIGYHFGIERIGDSYEVLVGRPLTMQGAHARGMNTRAIGVCFVGNYDRDQVPDEMLRIAFDRLIGPLMLLLGIPSGNIIYHRDYAPKTCPGKNFTKDITDRHAYRWCQEHAPWLWSGPTGHPL